MRYLVIFLMFVFMTEFCSAETYSWKDNNGIHFTDNIHNVPPKYRQSDGQKIVIIENQPSTERYLTEKDTDELYETCKNRVFTSLKAPATAKFGDYDRNLKNNWYKGDYLIVFDVDAQNSYGALIRKKYMCRISPNTRRVVDLF